MSNWIEKAVFYQIYPLGFCGAPKYNNENEVKHRILKILEWIPHLKEMNVNAIYLGPVFSSSEHGYDTKDYYHIDERLGSDEDFKTVCDELHKNGIRIVLDGVFNHVGREFWAFKDVLSYKEQSVYKDWFSNLHFYGSTPYNDPFTYDSWEGHYNLVKLNLRNPDVVKHLLDAVSMWIDYFGIDGLRLDAADCVDPEFFEKLNSLTKGKKHDFWLMGEIIHGDYSRWARKGMLDSTTNYEVYKGLYSSHNDQNYFEIAHSFNRLFGNGGLYKAFMTYNFVDNHDVHRIMSNLKDKRDIFNVYTMLYCAPGMPSVYYGSEWGMEARRTNTSDDMLRPCLELNEHRGSNPQLFQHLAHLGSIRENIKAFYGNEYESTVIRNKQLVFHRFHDNSHVYAVFNCAENDEEITFKANESEIWYDLISGKTFKSDNGNLTIRIPSKKAFVLCNETLNKEIEIKDIENKHDEEIVIEKRIGVYEHFKGNRYRVLGFAKHSETLEEYVMYQQLYGDESYWVRPSNMFFEIIERDGRKFPRFKFIHE